MGSASSGGIGGGIDAGDSIKVNFAGLEQGAADISASAGKIQGQLDQLKADLQPLVGSWTGEASTQYQAHQANWDQSAADLQQVLAQIGIAVRVAGEDYLDGERNNANVWGG
jgi:early secretory antigenic target protein ESAT-6